MVKNEKSQGKLSYLYLWM